ncbi:MAG: hypothetical protein CFH41_00420 [Alphaproteobacteria bacterium MarineAlpha11_Bin1]|nr:MAG: hypothetical protein CFH41_00420 [Alphaproteobacteria bacterium MarineAlpha11_Bin1]|tara:strand:+ start:7734 stop:8837 length:1104 start_codon:yes stop_codon:yes gene_type:complete
MVRLSLVLFFAFATSAVAQDCKPSDIDCLVKKAEAEAEAQEKKMLEMQKGLLKELADPDSLKAFGDAVNSFGGPDTQSKSSGKKPKAIKNTQKIPRNSQLEKFAQQVTGKLWTGKPTGIMLGDPEHALKFWIDQGVLRFSLAANNGGMLEGIVTPGKNGSFCISVFEPPCTTIGKNYRQNGAIKLVNKKNKSDLYLHNIGTLNDFKAYKAAWVDPRIAAEKLQKLVYSRDKWGRWDYFYFFRVLPTIDAGYAYQVTGGTREDNVMLIQRKIGFDKVASELIAKHPKWSAEDIYLETKNTSLSGKNTDKDHIFYLHKHRLTPNKVKKRATKLNAAYQACLKKIKNIGPTKRPKAPKKYCAEDILKNGV